MALGGVVRGTADADAEIRVDLHEPLELPAEQGTLLT
jgi:hypothetical protein